MKRVLLAIVIALMAVQPVFAATTFIIRHIRIKGLQRVSVNTVYNYLPIHIGQRYNTVVSNNIIESLYNTGFFRRIALSRSGNTLIIAVKERPIIAQIVFSGSKKIKYNKIKPIFKKLGLVVGEVYNSANLHEISQGLQEEYNRLGHFNAVVTTKVVVESRNRVAIHIHVIEGPVAKVASIVFVGNHAFPAHVLRNQFKLKTPGILSWYTKDDLFSSAQLSIDLSHLQNFYFNHGFLRFRVISHQVTLSPNHKWARVVIHIHEGAVYHLTGYRVQGKFAHAPEIMHMVSRLHVGAPFSRAQVIHIDKEIANHFADIGHAFPRVTVIPKINDVNHTVFLTFAIQIGPRVYVRQINFTGNDRTMDRVLRTQLLQMEDSLYSLKDINESKQRLALLPFLRHITAVAQRVPGHPDQVNMLFHAKEVSAGRAQVQGGYSPQEGILVGASISEPNFMGTGKGVSLSVMRSEYSLNASFSYVNPFYTPTGISRSFSIYYLRQKPSRSLNLQPYTMNDFGGAVTYGLPMSNWDRLSLGYGFDIISIHNVAFPLVVPPPIIVPPPLGPPPPPLNTRPPAAPIVTLFVAQHTSPFAQFNLTGAWQHVTLNRAVFPTHGNNQSFTVVVGVPLLGNRRSVGYFKMVYVGKWFFNLGHGFLIEPHTKLGAGGGFGSGIDGTLPFYNNFNAGGINSLPGFAPNSLGPFNSNDPIACGATAGSSATCVRTGGNVVTLAGVNLIFPNHISDRIRTALFIDAGNVFETFHAQYPALPFWALKSRYESISLKNMRVSTGLIVSWYSPMGPIEFSIGFPLVKKKSDDTELFGFSFGTGL